jgi:hypothetical protein
VVHQQRRRVDGGHRATDSFESEIVHRATR